MPSFFLEYEDTFLVATMLADKFQELNISVAELVWQLHVPSNCMGVLHAVELGHQGVCH